MKIPLSFVGIQEMTDDFDRDFKAVSAAFRKGRHRKMHRVAVTIPFGSKPERVAYALRGLASAVEKMS